MVNLVQENADGGAVAAVVERAPFSLTKSDEEVLAQTDDDFQPHSWDDMRNIIGR